jgi:hypothetical protein
MVEIKISVNVAQRRKCVELPLLPPYYSMRLLPCIVLSIETWKRKLLREKDLADFVAADIG